MSNNRNSKESSVEARLEVERRRTRRQAGAQLTAADIVCVDVKSEALSNVCIRCASDKRLLGSSVGGKA